MLENAERLALEGDASTAELLVAELHCQYPLIPISRPGRFLDTVKRIVAPTLQSRRMLQGTPLQSYLKRKGSPRTRNIRTQSK